MLSASVSRSQRRCDRGDSGDQGEGGGLDCIYVYLQPPIHPFTIMPPGWSQRFFASGPERPRGVTSTRSGQPARHRGHAHQQPVCGCIVDRKLTHAPRLIPTPHLTPMRFTQYTTSQRRDSHSHSHPTFSAVVAVVLRSRTPRCGGEGAGSCDRHA